MRVAVFGAGYVGLVTAACLAEVGHEVRVVEIDTARLAMLEEGRSPIHEADLEPMLVANLRAGRLSFTTDAGAAMAEAAVILIAVGTPTAAGGGADLSQVEAVSKTIGSLLAADAVIAVKSTVPVGTGDKVQAWIGASLANRGMTLDCPVVSNPEFLKEGVAVGDCMRPDRIIVGTADQKAAQRMARLYQPFNRNHQRLIIMSRRSAELTKYAANAMLATRISFMNELAGLADEVAADIEEVRIGIGSDPRIGYDFLYPGIGFGGSCFPKDLDALIATADLHGRPANLLRAVEAVNERQKSYLIDRIEQHYQGSVAGRKFALWGLSFKPGTDDMRAAPSLVLVERLLALGATIRAYDPAAIEEARRRFGDREGLVFVDSAQACLTDSDALIIATEWREFRSPDYGMLATSLRDRVVFDGRNILDPERAALAGLAWHGVGRVGHCNSVPAPAATPD